MTLRFYKKFWRHDPIYVKDIERSTAPSASSVDRNACNAASRAILSTTTVGLIKEGNYSRLLEIANEGNFYDLFLHTRAPDNMLPPKAKFDWVFGGESSSHKFPERRWLKGPAAAIHPGLPVSCKRPCAWSRLNALPRQVTRWWHRGAAKRRKCLVQCTKFFPGVR